MERLVESQLRLAENETLRSIARRCAPLRGAALRYEALRSVTRRCAPLRGQAKSDPFYVLSMYFGLEILSCRAH